MMKIDVVSGRSLGSPARHGVRELLRTLTHVGFDVRQNETSEAVVGEKTVLIGPVVHLSLRT